MGDSPSGRPRRKHSAGAAGGRSAGPDPPVWRAVQCMPSRGMWWRLWRVGISAWRRNRRPTGWARYRPSTAILEVVERHDAHAAAWEPSASATGSYTSKGMAHRVGSVCCAGLCPPRRVPTPINGTGASSTWTDAVPPAFVAVRRGDFRAGARQGALRSSSRRDLPSLR
jgi:hypothetical protein